MDNQAQLHATINAAIRAGVSFWPIDARGLVAQAPLGDATQGSPGGKGMYTGASRAGGDDRIFSNRKTLCLPSPRTPAAKRCWITTICGRHRAGAEQRVRATTSLATITTNDSAGRQISAHQNRAEQRPLGETGLSPGLFRRQDIRQVHGRRQRAAAGRRADAGRSDHGADHRDGGRLLPVESRRIFCADRGEDSGQRTGAGAQGRRRTHADRFHRRSEGRLRHAPFKTFATKSTSS